LRLLFQITGITTVIRLSVRGGASKTAIGVGLTAGFPRFGRDEIGDKCAQFFGYVHCTVFGSLIGDCADFVESNSTSALVLVIF
jgi:hypothetical protein